MKLLNGVVLCITILFWAVIALATVNPGNNGVITGLA